MRVQLECLSLCDRRSAVGPIYVAVHSQLQSDRHTVQIQGASQMERSRRCGSLSQQCLLSFCEYNGTVIFDRLQIQGVQWETAGDRSACAVGFGGTSRAEITQGDFSGNSLNSVIRLLDDSNVTIKDTRNVDGAGRIGVGEFASPGGAGA
jgi:hypothetical protein